MKGFLKFLGFADQKRFLLSTIACLALLIFALSSPVVAGTGVRDSMVKIYSVKNQPDYENPWNMKGPESISGSGCVIKGNRILTNAHVVSDQTFIQVRLHGHAKKYKARVLAISHEADLALLTVDDSSFFAEVEPLDFGELPQIEQEVIVYGFPEGGDTLSTTKGVVSRIEHHKYVHSSIELLAGQLDAAVNPGNSGGPVMVENRIVGIVMQVLENSQNIGYMVPVPVVEHFLTDMQDGRCDGFPNDGIFIQSLENESLKKMYGLNEKQSGVLVVSVDQESIAKPTLFPGDILLSIDGHRIADDGTVEFRPKERTSCDYFVQQHQVGEDVVFKILRKGKKQTIKIRLNNTYKSALMPMAKYNEKVGPNYFVYGGLVFSPLTLDYLLSLEVDNIENVPYSLIQYFVDGSHAWKTSEVVFILKVLPSDLNKGYEDYVYERIVEFNGIEVQDLMHLISLVELSDDVPFMVFKTDNGLQIALDRKKVEEEQSAILETYRISADRSANFSAVSTKNEDSNAVTALNPKRTRH